MHPYRSTRLPQLSGLFLICSAVILLCPAPTLAAPPLFDELQSVLRQIEAAGTVTFNTINIREVDEWVMLFPNGTLAAGRTLRFERGTSTETLADSLKYQEHHARFLRSKEQTCNAISGRIRGLTGQINMQAAHIRSAAQAGFDVSPALMAQLQAEQRSLQAVHKEELAHHREMLSDHQLITQPVAQQYSRLIDSYGQAVKIINKATVAELKQVQSLLERTIYEGGFTESVLLAYAMIRGGHDAGRAGDLLLMAGDVLKSSEALGFSPINMNRITLSIRCETGEDLQKTMRFIKSNRDITKSPAALYALGAWYESKGQWGEAARHFRMAWAKTEGDPVNHGVAAADVVFCTYKEDKLDPAALDGKFGEFVEDIRAVEQAGNLNTPEEWQVCRGLATIDLINGNLNGAKQHAKRGLQFAPPLGKRALQEF
jgi:tetratricopeptide (TPR) repeat protein